MIIAMSDMHGCFDIMQNRIDQVKPLLDIKENKLILLGDYIDRGCASYQCLKLAFDLQQEYGKEKVIVLKGNHEDWFAGFLFRKEDEWLPEDTSYNTTGTFLDADQLAYVKTISNRMENAEYLRQTIVNNHRDLLVWMNKLPLYYETETQIFVHAGVDEDIPEEEKDWCTLGTGENIMLGKFPPTTGYFYKTIIAGHVGASQVAGDHDFRGIYFDGQSHYYIDGTTVKTNNLLCLIYDEKDKVYYELQENGNRTKLSAQ